MLNLEEQEVVDSHKIWYFGAYLQWAWFEYPELQEQIGRKEYPELSRLKKAHDKMAGAKNDFDSCYLHSLPQTGINPLKLEQEAWKRLSPKIGQHLDEFGSFIEKYSPQSVDGERLLTHVNCGWDLLQDWNVISNSYNAKYKRNWDAVPEREVAIKQLIKELST